MLIVFAQILIPENFHTGSHSSQFVLKVVNIALNEVFYYVIDSFDFVERCVCRIGWVGFW